MYILGSVLQVNIDDFVTLGKSSMNIKFYHVIAMAQVPRIYSNNAYYGSNIRGLGVGKFLIMLE